MSVSYLFPEFEVVRSETRCTACRICEKQCACVGQNDTQR